MMEFNAPGADRLVFFEAYSNDASMNGHREYLFLVAYAESPEEAIKALEKRIPEEESVTLTVILIGRIPLLLNRRSAGIKRRGES